MTRTMYQPTEKQLKKWGQPGKDIDASMPGDDYFKFKANGKPQKAWGLKKRDYKLSLMTSAYEYQLGIWQGRVDAANGLEYSEERNENTYNLGYYRGYTNFNSDVKGWDKATRERFYQQYVEVN